jgi:LysM repeat protein
MNRILFSFCIFFFSFSTVAFAQNYVKHVVAKGETITQLASKYKVTPYDIYKLNPDSQAGIKERDVILIPSSVVIKSSAETPKPTRSATEQSNTKQANTASKTHTAKPKETLYSISREYKVNVEDLKNTNADILKDGLKVGQTVKIPTSENTVVSEPKAAPKTVENKPEINREPTQKATYHIVEPKETKFGISKKYGITVAELEKRNPSIVDNLPIGFKLIISGTTTSSETAPIVQKPQSITTEISQPGTVQTETIKKTHFGGFANYEVKPKETMFSLSQMFDVTQDELLTLNPTLKDGVKVGMILKVPGKGSMVMEASATQSKFVDLSKTINNKEKKQLVLLLPFNAAKIQGDTLKSIGIRLKKDAFLNMTLDFYSGALMAIDSAKVLGLNIDVKIFDSQENKVSSDVVNVVEKNNLLKANAVIGPFYQQYVETVAEMLAKNNVPVISPLSKETGKNLPNLYQSMPPSDFTKVAMFDFMKSKNGNILIVADPKRGANREFITQNFPGAQFVAVADNGTVDLDNLKALFVKGRMNYIVIDTEKTGMILSTTNILLNELANFQIQLVIIEPNETLDFEEVSMKRLTILKLLYPSLTRENISPQASVFENKYKEQNKIFPSQFAVRGFDVTLDTMLRLSQDKTFEASTNEDKTEQMESKFEYNKRPLEGYINKGVYILEYQEDLSVKQVNE